MALMRVAGGGDIVNVSSEIVGEYLPSMPENIRVTRYTSGSVGGTAFGDNFEMAEIESAYSDLMESGYLTRVAGPGMEPTWMADAIVIDVIHVRSFDPGHPELPN